MGLTLSGDVGRTGKFEDVALVQAALANIKAPGGKVFWPHAITGKGSEALWEAIKAFRAQFYSSGRGGDIGVIHANSEIERVLSRHIPAELMGMRVVYNDGEPLVYVTARSVRRPIKEIHRTEASPGATFAIKSSLDLLVTEIKENLNVIFFIEKRYFYKLSYTVDIKPVGFYNITRKKVENTFPVIIWNRMLVIFQKYGWFPISGKIGSIRSHVVLDSLKNAKSISSILKKFNINKPLEEEIAKMATAAGILIQNYDTITNEQAQEIDQITSIIKTKDIETARNLSVTWGQIRTLGFNPITAGIFFPHQIKKELIKLNLWKKNLELVGSALSLLDISLGTKKTGINHTGIMLNKSIINKEMEKFFLNNDINKRKKILDEKIKKISDLEYNTPNKLWGINVSGHNDVNGRLNVVFLKFKIDNISVDEIKNKKEVLDLATKIVNSVFDKSISKMKLRYEITKTLEDNWMLRRSYNRVLSSITDGTFSRNYDIIHIGQEYLKLQQEKLHLNKVNTVWGAMISFLTLDPRLWFFNIALVLANYYLDECIEEANKRLTDYESIS